MKVFIATKIKHNNINNINPLSINLFPIVFIF